MKTTPNYGLKIPEGTDAGNAPYYFEEGFTEIDNQLKANADAVASASNMTDDTTQAKYKWGVNNGMPYIEEV